MTYVARKPFRHAGKSYKPGDSVEITGQWATIYRAIGRIAEGGPKPKAAEQPEPPKSEPDKERPRANYRTRRLRADDN